MEKDITITAAYKAAEVYEKFIVPGVFRYWTPQLLKRAQPKTGEEVLDVACGTGVVARAVVPLVGKKGKVTGLDINPAMLAIACQQFDDHCDDIDWREGMAENLPFPANSYDLVTFQQGLQFFNDKPRAAGEMRRVLRGDGRAVVEVWQSMQCNEFYESVFETLANTFGIPITDVSGPYDYGDPAELEELLLSAGFPHVKVEQVQQDVHYVESNRFVELTIGGVAAVVPAFARMEAGLQSELLKDASDKLRPMIQAHTMDGILSFPMFANIATASMQ